jgi:hypothetical protein
MAERFAANPRNSALLDALDKAAAAARSLPFEITLWRVQNIFYNLMLTVYPEANRAAQAGDEEALAWIELFRDLGDQLRVRVD